MDAVLNFHAIDPNNLGDFLSSPFEYFEFPGYEMARLDILEFETYLTEPDRVPELRDKLADLQQRCDRLHVVLGGGGLLAARFQKAVSALRDRVAKPSGGKIFTWGVGQQAYGIGKMGQTIDRDEPKIVQQISEFPYDRYVANWDAVGVRDVGYGLDLEWLPCASCMHPAFDRERKAECEFVVYSHAKYELSLPDIPELSHTEQSLDRVLDFLGSAETVITSSYHGAYWATLLGRKVLAFPFTSKFLTLKHPVGLYPTPNWKQHGIYWRPFTKTFLNKFRLDIKFSNRFRCDSRDWRSTARDLPSHPNALSECRDRNREFHQSVCAAIGAASSPTSREIPSE